MKNGEKIIQDFWVKMSGNNIERIGHLNYTIAVMCGKNKVVRTVCVKKNDNKRGGDRENEIGRNFEEKEMIITISKKFLIITELIDRKQMPVIVKKWKKLFETPKGLSPLSPKGIEYKDLEGNIWRYLRYLHQNHERGSLSVKNETGESMIFIFDY